VRETATAEIQQQMVKAEQGVRISELEASAQVKRSAGESESFRLRATGESEGIRLRGVGEAEAIRATGTAKADAYRAGVEALGPQSYAMLQLIQVVGDRNVRIVPDVSVSGETGGDGLVAALLGSLIKDRRNDRGDVPSSK
jgi:uncharacterized membrane protein YqiK